MIVLKAMSRIRLNSKGSITVEAAIIFPIAFLCIFTIIFLGMLQYQRVYLKSVANRAAKVAALVWDNPSKSFDGLKTGFVAKDDLKKEPLYWHISSGNTDEKIQNIENYILQYINKNNVFSVKGYRITPDYKNYIIYKKLVIDIEVEYNIPTGNLFKVFGVGKTYIVKAQTVSVIKDPKEFINNTDMIIDVAKRTGIKDTVEGGITKAFSPLKESFDKIKDKIEGFFK